MSLIFQLHNSMLLALVLHGVLIEMNFPEMQHCEKISCKVTDCMSTSDGAVCVCRWRRSTELCRIIGLPDRDIGTCIQRIVLVS